MIEGTPPYPASYTFDGPDTIANWRPLVNWLLAIPHLAILYVLRSVSQVVGVISWVWIVFTGRLPAGLANLQSMYLRYGLRTYLFTGFLREDYPPFGFTTSTADPGDDPRVRVDFQAQLENRNRLTVFFRIILVIPQVVVLFFVVIGALVAYVIGFFSVLFTGKWSPGLRNYVLGVFRWSLRVDAYLYLLTDVYPPFSLD